MTQMSTAPMIPAQTTGRASHVPKTGIADAEGIIELLPNVAPHVLPPGKRVERRDDPQIHRGRRARGAGGGYVKAPG
jgi:hypothetical protein